MTPMKDFNLACFLQCAEEMLRADETASALWLLQKGLPGYYRDNPPQEVSNLINDIQARLATPAWYATTDGIESDTTRDVHLHMDHTLRGALIIREVKRLNQFGFTPHIVDQGPGEFWTPALLKHHNLKFTYKPVFLNFAAYKAHELSFKEYVRDVPPEGQPIIAFMCEIIEHLWNEADLRFDMLRYSGRVPDILHVSTPNCTFDVDCMDWKSKNDLGHLRTYTPNEFYSTVQRIFPEFVLIPYLSRVMHARGVFVSTKFAAIKEAERLDLFIEDPLPV